MYLYMQVTQDEYELPIYVCDSVAELSRLSGSTKANIRNCISRVKNGKRKKSRFVKVDIGKLGQDELL